MALFSIVVPVYRAERTLERCVRSVLAQRFADWELILVDDGSDDGSGALCDRYAAQDARVRVLHRENGGVSAARNAGIDMATGTYLCFLDSDDAFLPELLERFAQRLAETGADSAGCGHINELPDGTQTVEQLPFPAGVYEGEALRQRLVRPLLHDRLEGAPLLNGFIWRFCYTRAIIQAHGIRFSGAYLEDEVFLIEYFCLAEKLVTLDAALYVYLINPASVTHRYMPDFLETFRASFRAKQALVARYAITGIDGWMEQSAWAGLLIGVGNEYARGNPAGLWKKRSRVKALCHAPEFRNAMARYTPKHVAGNKRIVVALLRRRMFTALSLLYWLKNRGR